MIGRNALAVALAIIMLSPAIAVNCNQFQGSNLELCNTINQLNATNEDKESIINLAFYGDTSVPNHNFVSLWNTNIKMDLAPYGIPTQNKGIIKDAWLKILSVIPSVIENNTFYCDNIGKVQTEYNYRIELPQGTESEDCRTDYSFAGNSSNLDLSANNVLFGHEKISSFDIDPENLDFKAKLEIQAQDKIDHYKKYTYCCQYGAYGCSQYCTICKYSNTEIRTDILEIEDNLTAKADPNKPVVSFNTTNKYNGVTKGEVEAENFTSFLLSFADSYYKKSNYVYEYTYNFKPYDIITLKATPFEEKTSHNINIEYLNDSNFNFIVNNANNCTIKLFTHFKEFDFSCFKEYENKNLSILTDKIHYFVNDTILVDIYPKGLPITIQYGNITIIAQDNASFLADPLASRLIAIYGDETSEKVVSVTEKDRLILASKIIFFIFLNYITFSILTKSSFGLKWLTAA